MSDIFDTIKLVGGGMIGIAVVLVVVGSVVSMALGLAGGAAVLEPAPETATAVDSLDDPGESLTVRATTGDALRLDGGGSYVDDPTNASVFTDGGWTVALTADPDESALDDQTTATLYAADNESAHLLLEQGNWTARYESGGASAYVEAPADLTTRTPVAASYNTSSGELELYVDGTLADSAPLTSTVEPRNPAYAWVGSLDEVRVWDAALTPSRHSAYAADPVQPLPENASARLMFNDGQVTTTYYADGDATLVGDTSLVDGVAGPELVNGTDYETTSDPFTFRVLGGGYLDGAPVVFLSATSGPFVGVLESVRGIGASAFGLLVIGLLVGAAAWVQDQFSDF